MVLPSGAMIALDPTVEILTTVRPASIARILAIASCWTLSSVRPKSALFVCARMISALLSIISRISWSSAMSKQMASPAMMPLMSNTLLRVPIS